MAQNPEGAGPRSRAVRMRADAISNALRLECSSKPASRLAALPVHAARALRPAFPAYWGRKSNLGDTLSPVIIGQVLGVRAHHTKAPGKVLAIGSILHQVRPTDRVFGAGLMHEQEIDGEGAAFSAVRGPLTRALIRNADVPQVYGDPALLMPMFFRPRARPTGKVGLIPHYVDAEGMRLDDASVITLDVRDPDWASTIDAIASCDVVISSSLHGVIVAEAYGVPAVWVEASDKVLGGGFKFRDYYAASDRDISPVRWAPDLSRMLRTAAAPPAIDIGPIVAAGRDLREALANATR